MDAKNQFEALNKETLKKLEDYMEAKKSAGNVHSQKIDSAKEKWQIAWNEFLETLLTLEKLEI